MSVNENETLCQKIKRLNYGRRGSETKTSPRRPEEARDRMNAFREIMKRLCIASAALL